jgi:hypothetical protein
MSELWNEAMRTMTSAFLTGWYESPADTLERLRREEERDQKRAGLCPAEMDMGEIAVECEKSAGHGGRHVATWDDDDGPVTVHWGGKARRAKA